MSFLERQDIKRRDLFYFPNGCARYVQEMDTKWIEDIEGSFLTMEDYIADTLNGGQIRRKETVGTVHAWFAHTQ